MNWFSIGIILFSCIMEVFLMFDYFHNFFEIKVEKRYVKFICAAVCILLFGVNAIGKASINLFAVPFLMWALVSLLFEARLGVRLGYFVIAYSVMIGVEFLYSILAKTTTAFIQQEGMIPVSDYMWQMILIKLLNFLIFLILKQTSNRSHYRMSNKIFMIYMCIPVSTLGIMVITFYSGVDFAGNTVLRIIMTIFFIFMVVANMTVFYGFQKHTEKLGEDARQQLEIQHKNAEIARLSKIAEMNEAYNEAVHNMTHVLKAIDQLAVEKKNEEIRSLIEDLNGTLMQGSANEYSNHRMVNAILSEYKARAEKMGIGFDVYVEPGCILEHIKDMDLVSMMGNLLDNAITAAAKVNPSMVTVRIFMHMKGKMCIIKVVNDFMGRLEEVGGKVISTKEEEGIHGIGLASVLKTAEKYNGSFSYYVEDKKFHAVLVLPVK